MPCFHPLNAWQSRPGAQPQFTPAAIKLQLSCGQCIGCRLEHSRQWALRCMHEASFHQDNCFITLTYSEENLPYGNSLVKSHYQKFIKRLRWKNRDKRLRYFMCGEYGGELGRPHYHALIFGHDFKDKEIWQTRDGVNTYVSEELDSTWGKGFATVGAVTWETAAYVSRYCLKKRNGKEKENHYSRIVEETGELIQIQQEYAQMSLKPAIGRQWFEAYQGDCYPSDFITHKGRKLRVPKYYDTLLERNDLAEYQRIKEQRKQRALAWEHEQTPSRRAAREQCTLARSNQLKRTIQ